MQGMYASIVAKQSGVCMQAQLRIKLISKYVIDEKRLNAEALPGVRFVSGNVDYDWLVVYDDLPAQQGEKLPLTSEPVRSSPDRSILLTYEPASIKFYGDDYVRQFAHVLTSHDEAMLKHPNRHAMPPVGIWYYGDQSDVDDLPVAPEKTHHLSVFYSGKTMQHSLHDCRYQFITGLMARLGDELDVFGRGYRPVEKKRLALDQYRYHIAVENHQSDHHWTEKLSDCYLGYCMPIYAGCGNVDAYFPGGSFIRVDPRDVDGAVEVIQRAIQEGAYEKNAAAIQQARRLVLKEYSLGYLLSEYILAAENTMQQAPLKHVGSAVIHSRHLLMRKWPLAFLRYALGKIRSRLYHRKKWYDYLQAARQQHA